MSTSGSATLPIAVLIATRDRPEALGRALASLAAQQVRPAEVLVLDNASVSPLRKEALPDPGAPLSVMRSDAPLGVGAARRLLCASTQQPLALLLDDDAWLTAPDTLSRVAHHFGTQLRSAALGFTVVHETGEGEVVRTPVGTRASIPQGAPREAGCFLGGAHALRLAAALEVGGYDPAFRYGEEELDLTYRLVSAGHQVWFDPALVARHRRPDTEPRRAPAPLAPARLQGRAYLAARYLPFPYAATFLLAWTLYALAQSPGRPGALGVALWRGVQQARARGRRVLSPEARRRLQQTGGRLWM